MCVSRITPADAGTRRPPPKQSIAYGDHPRGCGDKNTNHCIRTVAAGSPPRMRGQGYSIFSPLYPLRITPADAGTSRLLALPLLSDADHPRGCGDKLDVKPDGTLTVGSPPRMRGQVNFVRHQVIGERITPADAGTRRSAGSRHVSSWDHPRGCGDKKMSCFGANVALGSPPRMRGQV